MLRFVFALLAVLLGACSIYPSWDGVYNNGPVDPITYPPPYLGANGDRTKPALGTFTAIAAKSRGEDVQFYLFPFSPVALPSGKVDPKVDPLALIVDGKPNTKVPVSTVQVFDGKAGERPFRASPACVTPQDYTYDPRRDDMRSDEQSPVFSAVPNATYDTAKLTVSYNYMPIVAEVSTSNTEQCQKYRATPTPPFGIFDGSGYFLAWAQIDPGAAVYKVGETSSNSVGMGVQKYGWFNFYITAFIDGGYIPTRADTNMDGTETVHMVTQKLYYPRSKIATKTGDATAAQGKGYDVLDAPRGRSGYSPVCELFTYDAGAPVTVDKLPQDVDTIIANFGATLQPGNPTYIFCLQAE